MGVESMSGIYTAEKVCLDVVAEVSAMVTHEVNNSLAVINENAGYLDDLVLMVGEDGELPAERVKRSVTSIASQVRRTNNLMKKLNRFAHSGDEPVAAIDLVESLQVMITLTGRKADSSEISVGLESVDPVIITTKPQMVYTLIYLCLRHLYQEAGAGSVVKCEVYRSEDEEEVAVLRFQVTAQQGANFSKLPEDRSLALIIAEVSAKVQTENDGILVKLPHSSSMV